MSDVPLSSEQVATCKSCGESVTLAHKHECRGIQPRNSSLELTRDIAAATAHRACCGTEHDPEHGKLHGCCVVCGVPWPCETAQYFLRKPA